MSFHKKLAAKARVGGHSSNEFHAAAQKHANATWVYAIVGAAVWYFAGFWWALIPFALAAYTMLQSFSATLTGKEMEELEAQARGRPPKG